MEASVIKSKKGLADVLISFESVLEFRTILAILDDCRYNPVAEELGVDPDYVLGFINDLYESINGQNG